MKESWRNIQEAVDEESPLVKGEVPRHGGLRFEGIEAKVRVWRWTPMPRVEPRVLLEPVSGAVRRGEVLALLGSSGAGKTTLLDALARRGAGRHLATGRATFVGADATEATRVARHWRHATAYVTQEDVLNPSLSVYETLLAAALLRLPSSVKLAEKRRRVRALLSELGLEHVAQSRVGGGSAIGGRGISGGEMRRLSVAMEMVTDPAVLFLDEPTSGLDASSAFTLVSRLQLLARDRGTAIVLSVHQPSSRVFAMFDRVLILAPRGRCVFFGAPAELPDYLQSCGLPMPSSFNPADFVLDLVSQPEPLGQPPRNVDERVDALRTRFLQGAAESSGKLGCGDAFARSEAAQVAKDGIDDRQRGDEDEEGLARRMLYAAFHFVRGGFAASAPLQFAILVARNTIALLRDPLPLILLTVTYLFSAVMIGLLFRDLHTNKEEQLTLGLGFTLDVVGIQAFFAVPSYTLKRAIFNREHAAGSYRTSMYMLSNMVVTLPVDLFMSALYSVIVFYFVGLRGGFVDSFLPFLLVVFLQMEFYLGMNEAVGAAFRHLEIAIGVAGLVMIILMSFSGVMVQYHNIPWFLRWAYWATPQTYSMSALMLLQFDNYDVGKLWLDSFGIQMHDLWTCVLILAACAIAARFILLFVLLFLRKGEGR